MVSPKKFISIIWGYPSSLYNFSLSENYHLHVLSVAKSLGYNPIAFVGMADVGSVEKDPNFSKDVEVIYYKNFWQYLTFLFKYRKEVFYVNTFVWQSFIVPFISRRAIFMGHHTVNRKNKIKQLIQDIVFKFFYRIRVVTPGEKEFLIKHGTKAEKVFVVPLVVNADLFRLSLETKREGLVYLGNITKKKNLVTILKALSIVKKTHGDVKLDIIGSVGDDPFWPTVDALGLQGSINFIGHVPHNKLPEYLNKYKVYINSSTQEGQCLAVYESALCGLALCLPNILAFSDNFKDKALFHEVYDAEMLAKNIIRYLWDENLRLNCAQQAGTFAKDYCSAQVIEEKLKLIFKYDWLF